MQIKKQPNNYPYIFLVIFSILYKTGILVKNFLYNSKILKPKIIPCKVLSIGNLSVGGTGKTPAVYHIARLLQKKGYKPGIISRGYGRESKGTFIVTDGITKPDKWEKYGDEPYLLSKKLNNIPIAIGESRYKAGIKLIKKFDCDVIIMDDGFQHRFLHRDINILLINSKDTNKKEALIPFGYLREPIENIKRSDLVILTKSNQYKPNKNILKYIEKMKLPIVYSKIIPRKNLISYKGEKLKLNNLKNKHIYIFSALGDPDSFEKSIELTGAVISGHHKFEDHHNYSNNDLKIILRAAKKTNAEYLITTEKDIVKINNYTGDVGLYALKMEVIFEPKEVLNNYIRI